MALKTPLLSSHLSNKIRKLQKYWLITHLIISASYIGGMFLGLIELPKMVGPTLFIFWNCLYMFITILMTKSYVNYESRFSKFSGRPIVKEQMKKGIDISTYHAVKCCGISTPAQGLIIAHGLNRKHSWPGLFLSLSQDVNEEIIEYLPDIKNKNNIIDFYSIRVYPDLKIILLKDGYAGDIEDKNLKEEILKRYFLDRFREIPNLITSPFMDDLRKIKDLTCFDFIE